jgi:hypothetical protein
LRTVDYSTRGVISAGRIKSNSPKDQIVKFTYTGIPLSHLCNLFYPFFLYEIRNWAEDLFTVVKEIKDNKGDSFKLVDPMSNFTPDKIKKLINLYIKSPDNRLDPLTIKVQSNKTDKIGEINLNIYEDSLHRRFTLLDLVYMTAVKVCKDKHVYVTRYPVNNFQSIYPSRIKIVTTYKTEPKVIGDTNFEDYPYITSEDLLSPSTKGNITFIDTIIPHNTMLQSLGADFDGKRIKNLS